MQGNTHFISCLEKARLDLTSDVLKNEAAVSTKKKAEAMVAAEGGELVEIFPLDFRDRNTKQTIKSLRILPCNTKKYRVKCIEIAVITQHETPDLTKKELLIITLVNLHKNEEVYSTIDLGLLTKKRPTISGGVK